ncbi:unnamed protein product [Ilex paraguariensis]|uniref:Uncharacterized protein n=1 Tax=Ilex paraguariensis TaxID=185542 RepID=A0ABC8T6X4_9AQUA
MLIARLRLANIAQQAGATQCSKYDVASKHGVSSKHNAAFNHDVASSPSSFVIAVVTLGIAFVGAAIWVSGLRLASPWLCLGLRQAWVNDRLTLIPPCQLALSLKPPSPFSFAKLLALENSSRERNEEDRWKNKGFSQEFIYTLANRQCPRKKKVLTARSNGRFNE